MVPQLTSTGQESKNQSSKQEIKSSSNFINFSCLSFFCVLFRVDFTHMVLSLLAVVTTRF